MNIEKDPLLTQLESAYERKNEILDKIEDVLTLLETPRSEWDKWDPDNKNKSYNIFNSYLVGRAIGMIKIILIEQGRDIDGHTN